MNRFDFSTNWNNKLQCDYYTTLRLSGRYERGRTYEVWHKGQFLHHARVMGKKTLSMDTITEWIAYIDTGYSREECCKIIRRMYPKIDDIQWQVQPIYFYLLKAERLPITA